MNEMERQVMGLLLSGDHPLLASLRDQLAVAKVSRREFTGVGFFTYFEVPLAARRLPSSRRIVIDDVHAEIQGLEHGAGFLLFVEDGALNNLECSICENAWPSNAKLVRAFFMHPKSPNSSMLVETKERDLPWVLKEG
jgi:hypothetical protein